MRQLLIIFSIIVTFILMNFLASGQTCKFVNPTGLYKYSGKSYKKDGETYGYFGNVKVYLVDSSTIHLNFYICKGAPSYNSGSFIETLNYKNNKAVYFGDTTMPELTCKLTFDFTKTGINVELHSVNPNWACGFGHSVDAKGYYKKIKRKVPTKEKILNYEE